MLAYKRVWRRRLQLSVVITPPVIRSLPHANVHAPTDGSRRPTNDERLPGCSCRTELRWAASYSSLCNYYLHMYEIPD